MQSSREEAGHDENDSIEGQNKQQAHDYNAETMSSNGSDNGKGNGSGSGGGYSADCSSSDASSNGAAKRSPLVLENEMQQLFVGDGDSKTKSKENRGKKAKTRSSLPPWTASTLPGGDFPRVSKDGAMSEISTPSMAQWNGVRIHHPMDPRIDISTVGHIHTSSFSVFPVDVHNGENNNNSEAGQSHVSANHPPPSVDQYMTLMEVVRPFFYAHGIANHADGLRETKINTSFTKQQQNATTLANQVQHFLHESGVAETMLCADGMVGSTRRPDSPTSTDSDGSSMVVLARVRRKHLRKRSSGDPENNETNSSSNGASNVSSEISSDRRVENQSPEQPSRRGQLEHCEEDDHQSLQDHVDEAEMERHNASRAGQDNSTTSASSSRIQNNANIPIDAPLGVGGGGVPAVVSEYASSRVGSSGSNTHQTSSSGSGRNTGSGTGSGSNQGGSSGSGNDQGGMSSNGIGSSGSGNDQKGSGEETRDNCGANNSGEGNSDESNSNGKPSMSGIGEPTHTLVHQLREPEKPTQSTNAFREKKLIDKKRKRMNMRREYEEKVQQEMESSEGSDENEFLKPGRPVTLDKVLSLTKKARIVVNASPPFLVVHTNAGYCRLSGIDSHTVVGKPVSDLLSIPDPQTLEGVKAKHLQPPEIPGADEVDDYVPTHDDIVLHHAESTEGLTAAEAAGRARAAASQEDSIERLVAASGFGRYNIINLSAKALNDPNFGISKSLEAHPSRSRNREEGSNGSSITSSSESCLHITCSMSISPVVSSPEAFAAVTDKDLDCNHPHHKSKRRKHHSNDTASSSTASHHPPTRRSFPHREVIVSRKRQLITHYVIQLETIDGTNRKEDSTHGSGSESSIRPQHHSLTKSEILGQEGLGPRTASTERPASNHPERDANEQENDDEMDSESSHPHDCIAAIG